MPATASRENVRGAAAATSASCKGLQLGPTIIGLVRPLRSFAEGGESKDPRRLGPLDGKGARDDRRRGS